MSDTSKVDFLYLSEKDMIDAGVLDGAACVDTIGEVLALCSEGDYLMGGEDANSHGIALMFPKEPKFPDIPKAGPDRRFMAMPAFLGGKFDMAGQKWYGSNKANNDKGLPRSILMVTLNDIDTGAPVAYMSGNLESAMRTGAVPMVAAKYLAKEDAKVAAFIGAGVIATTSLICLMAVRPSIDTVKIKASSVTSKSAKKFEAYIHEHFPTIKNVTICETLEECVRDADIINEAVSVHKEGDSPLIKAEWIKKGAVILSSMNISFEDDFLLNGCTKVLDNLDTYQGFWEGAQKRKAAAIAAGKKPTPFGCLGVKILDFIKQEKLTRDDVTWIGELVRGKKPGRTSDDEIFVVGCIGMPIEDIGWGLTCYQNALKKGIGTKLNLWDEPYLC